MGNGLALILNVNVRNPKIQKKSNPCDKYFSIFPVINCGVLLPPLNGEIDLRNGTLLGAVVEYSCNAGHLLNGSESRVCQESGQWSQSQPTCLCE